MALPGTTVDRIRKSLLSAYPKKSDLEQMVRIELDESLDAIVGGRDQTEVIFALITWAESQGRLGELIDAAINRNSTNPELVLLNNDVQFRLLIQEHDTGQLNTAFIPVRVPGKHTATDKRMGMLAVVAIVLVAAIITFIVTEKPLGFGSSKEQPDTQVTEPVSQPIISPLSLSPLSTPSTAFNSPMATSTPTPQGLIDTSAELAVFAGTATPNWSSLLALTAVAVRVVEPDIVASDTNLVGQVGLDQLQRAQVYYEIPTQLQLADGTIWPNVVGAPEPVVVGGEVLGVTPWVLVEIRLLNPSGNETYALADTILLTAAYTETLVNSDTLWVNAVYAPSYLLNESCISSEKSDELSSAALLGIEPPEGGHFLGMLPTKPGLTAQFVQGASNRPQLSVPPKTSVNYLFYVSATKSGIYEFELELEFVSSDFVRSAIQKEFVVSFLDMETAGAIENKKFYTHGDLVDLCGDSSNN